MSSHFYCGECGQRVHDDAYHPYLYCVLFKAGVEDQDAFLDAQGWARVEVSPTHQDGETK